MKCFFQNLSQQKYNTYYLYYNMYIFYSNKRFTNVLIRLKFNKVPLTGVIVYVIVNNFVHSK